MTALSSQCRLAVGIVCCLFISVPAVASAQSPAPDKEDIPVQLQFPNSDLTDVLKVYANLSKRKVWVELGLTGTVSIYSDKKMSRSEALSLIRGALLNDNHIDIHEVCDSEAFVTKSLNPTTRNLLLSSPSPSGSPHIRRVLQKQSGNPSPSP